MQIRELLWGRVPVEAIRGEAVSMGTLIAFASVCLGVIVLRQARHDVPRPFNVPLYPWVPIAGLASCTALTLSLPRIPWLNLAVWLVVGMMVFFLMTALKKNTKELPGRSVRENVEPLIETHRE